MKNKKMSQRPEIPRRLVLSLTQLNYCTDGSSENLQPNVLTYSDKKNRKNKKNFAYLRKKSSLITDMSPQLCTDKCKCMP